MSITIRLRSPTGTSSLQLASLECSLQELRQKIYEAYPEILFARQDLRLGFPPKALTTSTSPDATLSSLGIKNGEPVIVAELTEDRATLSSSSLRVAPPPAATATARNAMSPASAASKSAPVDPVPAAPRVPAPATSATAGRVESVPVDGGYLVLRVVPDDNSCLFRAVGLVVDPGRADAATYLRKVVAEAILADPETWSEAVLGRSPASYVSTITQKDSWGGAIELSIFAAHFKREICSVDVLSGRIDRFGQGEGYDSQVLVVYSGIHYDALTFSYALPDPWTVSFPPPNVEFDTTSFPVAQDAIVDAALKLVARLRATHAYTDMATFTLKCEVCGKGLVGEKEARSHASETSHTSFGEYDG